MMKRKHREDSSSPEPGSSLEKKVACRSMLKFSIDSIMQRPEPRPAIKTELEQLAGNGNGAGADAEGLLAANPRAGLLSSASSASSASSTSMSAQSAALSSGGASAASSSSSSSSSASSCNASANTSAITCQLDNKDMWDKFHSLNTEMIITKTGRRMFPVMKVQFHNLDPQARYAVSMDIVPVDNKRYRYAYHKSSWQVAGKADPSAEPRLYPHPDSPFNGDLLSRQVISFEKVKLTNNEMDKSGHIILNSMHKYQPRVHLIELKPQQQQQQQHCSGGSSSSTSSSSCNQTTSNHSKTTQAFGASQASSTHRNQNQMQPNQQQSSSAIEGVGYQTFVFPETVFTAVTAYQNQLITKMKIDKNPFAKGFRDSSRLSDLDRNDPFDYLGSSAARFVAGGQSSGSVGPIEAAAAAAAGAHMDAYQFLASAANNPWYSVVAAAAAAGQPVINPLNPMAGLPGGASQAMQMQATQAWIAALASCLNGGGLADDKPEAI